MLQLPDGWLSLLGALTLPLVPAKAGAQGHGPRPWIAAGVYPRESGGGNERIFAARGLSKSQSLPGMRPFGSEKQYLAMSPARVYQTLSLCLCSTQCLMAWRTGRSRNGCPTMNPCRESA
jgi:hypothetical protein